MESISSLFLIYKVVIDNEEYLFEVPAPTGEGNDMKSIVIKKVFEKYPQFKGKGIDVYFITTLKK